MENSLKSGPAVAIRRAKIRRRKALTALAAIVIIAATAFLVVGKFTKKNDGLANMSTGKVQRATITKVISATGSITAQTGAQVKIGSQITGRIKRLFADVGSHVHAGQVIAELDLPDMKAQLDQAIASLELAKVKLVEQQSGVGFQQTNVTSDIAKARANVNSALAVYNQAVLNEKLQVSNAEASVTQLKASANNAHTFLKRATQIVDKGWIAQQDVDNARTQADVADAQLDATLQNLAMIKTKGSADVQTTLATVQNYKAVLAAASASTAQNVIKAQQVAEARLAVDQAKAQVDYWRAQYAKTVIQTPISGTVLALDVQQGETIAAGLSAPTLIRVIDLSRLQVDALVDETDIGGVRVGQPATVTVDAYPNRTFQARVEKIASGATMQQNVVTYDTTLSVENPGGVLKPDMTATVKIVVGDRRNVLAVPIEAVKSGKDGQIVYVVGRGGKIITRKVVTGISDDSLTEIISGLSEGQTIVLAGYPPQGGLNGPGGMRMAPFGPAGGGGGGGGGRSGGRRGAGG